MDRTDDPPRAMPWTLALVLLGFPIEAAMPILVAEDRGDARRRFEDVLVDLLQGLHR